MHRGNPMDATERMYQFCTDSGPTYPRGRKTDPALKLEFFEGLTRARRLASASIATRRGWAALRMQGECHVAQSLPPVRTKHLDRPPFDFSRLAHQVANDDPALNLFAAVRGDRRQTRRRSHRSCRSWVRQRRTGRWWKRALVGPLRRNRHSEPRHSRCSGSRSCRRRSIGSA